MDAMSSLDTPLADLYDLPDEEALQSHFDAGNLRRLRVYGYAFAAIAVAGALWFLALFFLIPIWETFYFFLIHRMLHWPPLYRLAHALHHRNTNVGPWSGLAMHPVEHIIYFSTVVVQWLVALHPVNALYQIHLAAFYPALGHAGFDKLKLGAGLEVDGSEGAGAAGEQQGGEDARGHRRLGGRYTPL